MQDFIVVGDIHYEALSAYLPEDDYLTPISQTLRQIWKYARENDVHTIIIAGDVFDNPYPRDDAKKAFLKSLDPKLQYHIILGNHDIATTEVNSLTLCKYFIEDLQLMDNVKFYMRPQQVEIGKLKFDMLPFPHTKPISPNTICIGHFDTKGSLMDNGRISKSNIQLDTRTNSWFLGHLHRRQGNIYPGSICQHKFGEPTNKYFFHCRAEDELNIEINAISINTPYKMVDVIATKIEDIKLDKENIYRIFVADHLDYNQVNKAIAGYHVWQIKGIVKDSKGNVDLSEADLQFQAQNLADERTYLELWLKNKENVDLTEEQIQRALEIADKKRQQN